MEEEWKKNKRTANVKKNPRVNEWHDFCLITYAMFIKPKLPVMKKNQQSTVFCHALVMRQEGLFVMLSLFCFFIFFSRFLNINLTLMRTYNLIV